VEAGIDGQNGPTVPVPDRDSVTQYVPLGPDSI
jgi:hypothetical protein